MADDFGSEMAKEAGVDKLPTRKELDTASRLAMLLGYGAIDSVEEWLAYLAQIDEAGIDTGWPTIDAALDGGIRPEEVILIAARTGVGKSWILQYWAERELMKNPDLRVLFFTFEMSGVHLGERIAAHAMGASPFEVRKFGKSGDLTAGHVSKEAPHLARMQVNEHTVRLEDIGESIRVVSEHLGAPVGLVCIDYLGLLKSKTAKGGRLYEAVSEVARGLKEIAKEHSVVILTAAQLSRAGGGSGMTEPYLDSLRDSGVTEEAADRILMMWQVELDEGDKRQLIKVKVAKNRFGYVTLPVTLAFDAAMRLDEAPEYELQEYLEGLEPSQDIPF